MRRSSWPFRKNVGAGVQRERENHPGSGTGALSNRRHGMPAGGAWAARDNTNTQVKGIVLSLYLATAVYPGMLVRYVCHIEKEKNALPYSPHPGP